MTDNNKILVSPLAWVVPAISLLGFVIVWLNGFNQEFFLWLNSLGRGEISIVAWSSITLLGDTLVAFALLTPFVRKRPDIIWAILIAALFSTLWVHGLKPVIGHLRPAAVLPTESFHIIGTILHKGSFPSGHTTTAFTLAGVLCLSRTHPAIITIALLMATLVGFSRAVVGAHWPMDIFAGAFGGWLAALIGVLLFKHLSHIKNWDSRIPGRLLFNTGLLIISVSLLFYDSGYPDSQIFQYLVAIICTITIAFNFWFLFKTEKQL